MTTAESVSREIPVHLDRAWQLLAAAVPDDVFADMVLSEAADALIDVFPPYTPARAPLRSAPQADAVRAARVELALAASAADSIEERLRVAGAIHRLQQLTGYP